MLVVESIKVASYNLIRHKLRTALTMLGMIFGVAAVLAMLSISAGAEKEALSVIEKMGLRNIIVRAKEFEREQLKIIRQDSPGLTMRDVSALEQALSSGTVVIGKKYLKTYQAASVFAGSDSQVQGVGFLYPKVANLQIVEGGFFLPVDERQAHQVCVLGKDARRKLFGLNEAIGQSVKINQEWFDVIGVIADERVTDQEFEGVKLESSNNGIYLPLQTLLSKFELDPVEDQLDEIIVHTASDTDIREQATLISSLMARMHQMVDDFSLVVPEKLLQQSRETQQIFTIVMGAIASISLIVGGIGIMNIMLASVLERTNEIGLRRCVGARRRDIGRQFMLEALAISISGAFAGIVLGYAITHGVSLYSGWPTIMTPLSVVLGVGVSVSVGLVSGIYPARKAALVSPIEALRYE